MRTITRKTNVRRHNRHLPRKETNVRQHLRTVNKRLIGTIPIKDLTYPQAKRRFPFINPNADYDGDRVINKKDCRPFDVDRQDEIDDMIILGWEDEKDDLIQCPNCSGYGGGSGPGMECPLCNRKGKVTNELREKYLEKDWFKVEKPISKMRELAAEERARKASPLGDYDGDGVCNADDCHPLDPNRQDYGQRPVAGIKIHHQIPIHALRDNLAYDKDKSMEPFKKIQGERDLGFIEKQEKKEVESAGTKSKWLNKLYFEEKQNALRENRPTKSYGEVISEAIEKQKMKSKAYDYLDEDFD